jgi:hypothetical protein
MALNGTYAYMFNLQAEKYQKGIWIWKSFL